MTISSAHLVASNADVLGGSLRVSSPKEGEKTRDEPLRTSALEATHLVVLVAIVN